VAKKGETSAKNETEGLMISIRHREVPLRTALAGPDRFSTVDTQGHGP
jgi:hypothetical protein